MAIAERILNLQPLADNRSDQALVYAVQHGQPEAASVLVERYYPRIYSFVSHLTYGRGSAEDLTQEVFARALKALGRFNGEYLFEHWLLRIAKNLCIDEARRNLRSPLATDPVELPEIGGLEAPDYVWESVSRDLVAAVVHRALAAMPPRQRTILAMREMEAMSYADIAQVVGTNPRGVEATLRRARVRFRAEIALAEAAEESRAQCRRVLHLVTDNPQAAGTEEAAGHLARCAECRRATRAAGTAPSPSSKTAFGLAPLAGLAGLAHRGWLLRARGASHVFASSLRRGSDRLRSAATLAGAGTGAAMAFPLARMAEVTAGVLVATAVTMAPTLPAVVHPAVTTAAYLAAATPQVASVAPVSVLYHAAPAATSVSQAPSSAETSASEPAPSIAGAGNGGLLGSLGLDNLVGLGISGGVAATAVNGVASVSSILADQVSQVAQMGGTTLGTLTGTGPLAPIAPIANQVSQTVTSLGKTVAGTLKTLGTTLPRVVGAPNSGTGAATTTGGGAATTQPQN